MLVLYLFMVAAKFVSGSNLTVTNKNAVVNRFIVYMFRVSLDDVVWTDEAVRSAVFMLLKEVSQTTLSKMSPLPQVCCYE